ncbi:MAG: hypothetical protein JXA46_07430 [Dehalococcoidales bacterium]|nr:hypothetical protein [Dehalococcoidales bacterium]
MSESLFAEKLNWFKQNEKPEVVLIIADNPELIKIIIGWSNLDVQSIDELTNLAGASDNEIWEWLWENSHFRLTELKAKAGVPCSESVLEQKMKLLIGNHILYPDGTVNSFVQRYLRSEVARLFVVKQRKSTMKVSKS